MLEIGCAWSKGSGERLQGNHGPLVVKFEIVVCKLFQFGSLKFVVW